MPYITREDGVRFVIPSYRDTITAKKTSALKKEILLLSATYGEYITLQKKSVNQYEVAFSSDTGYLLGECIWQHFNRSFDLVYCEAIPNTTEAILVIVKAGTVYLDGTFPIDSIAEELVVFKTQANTFSIYTYGDVPISEKPQEGKFSFDVSSVKSFTVLDKPVFPTLEGVKAFQLQMVETVLTAYGIGVLPVKQIAVVVVVIALCWMLWTFISSHKKELPTVIISTVSPYQYYNITLTSPDPTTELTELVRNMMLLLTMPGWKADAITYTPGLPGALVASVKSSGARTNVLFDWAQKNNAKVQIQPDGFYVTLYTFIPKRQPPKSISSMQEIISSLLDRMSYVLPGNVLKISATTDKKFFSEMEMVLSINSASPMQVITVAQQLKDLPIVITKISGSLSSDGNISSTITFKVLGN